MTELDDDRDGIEPEALDEDAGDPAAAFDALRRTIETQGEQIGAEMKVMRRGLEAAFDQLDKIEPQTDYKPQLAQLVQALDTVAERLHGGPHQALAGTLERRRIVLRALPENRRLLDAVHPLRNAVERLHELGELGLIVGLRLDLFELVEGGFQPATDDRHFRADLRALRLDRPP